MVLAHLALLAIVALTSIDVRYGTPVCQVATPTSPYNFIHTDCPTSQSTRYPCGHYVSALASFLAALVFPLTPHLSSFSSPRLSSLSQVVSSAPSGDAAPVGVDCRAWSDCSSQNPCLKPHGGHCAPSVMGVCPNATSSSTGASAPMRMCTHFASLLAEFYSFRARYNLPTADQFSKMKPSLTSYVSKLDWSSTSRPFGTNFVRTPGAAKLRFYDYVRVCVATCMLVYACMRFVLCCVVECACASCSRVHHCSNQPPSLRVSSSPRASRGTWTSPSRAIGHSTAAATTVHACGSVTSWSSTTTACTACRKGAAATQRRRRGSI